MEYGLYVGTLIGAVAVYLMLPSNGRRPTWVGTLLGLGAMAWIMVQAAQLLGGGITAGGMTSGGATSGGGLNVFYYVFTGLAVISAVRVITHRRPVYSALYFIMVVLSVTGLLVLLDAEFMAFALVIIYAGAILVTYLFVIMLATLPQVGEEEVSPIYDREAREPLGGVVMGFALLAVIGQCLLSHPLDPVSEQAATARWEAAAAVVPGRLNDVDELTRIMRDQGVIDQGRRVTSVDVETAVAQVQGGSDETTSIAIPANVQAMMVTNIDRVGLNLFESHTLGIELAGVILLMSMVGAIVIARKVAAVEAVTDDKLRSREVQA